VEQEPEDLVMSEEEAARLLGLESERVPNWTQGVLITDSRQVDNPIIFASDGFAILTGYAREEVLARNCRFLQGPGTDRGIVAAIRDAVRARRRFDGEILNYRKDGSPFWNRLSIGPLATAESDGLFVGLQFDVSSRHRGDGGSAG
jgi:PAS domain S-box-containing protein